MSLGLWIISALLILFPAPAWAGVQCPCDCPALTEHATSPETGASATLSVDSKPHGAEVYVDSEYQGLTPLRNVHVHSGDLPVTFVKEGFQRQTVHVALKPGEKWAMGTVPLTSAYGEITLRSFPARATVILDGEKLNARTPVIIRRVPRDKPHTIELQKDGYDAWQRIIKLDDQDSKKYDVNLPHKSQ